MRTLFVGLLGLLLASAGTASAGSLFAQSNPYSTASIALTILGLAILSLTGVSSVGALVAAVWVSAHRRTDARHHRRPVAAQLQ